MKKSLYFLFWIILTNLCLSAEAQADSKSEPMDSGFEQQPVYWYEREVRKQAWMALDEVAVFPKKGKGTKLNRDLLIKQLHPKAVITKRNNFLIYLKTPERMERKLILERIHSLRRLDSVSQASPVFYTGRKRHPATRLVLTGEIIVQFPKEFPESKIATIEKQYGLERLKPFPFTQNTFLYCAGEPMHSLEVANDLYESGQVDYAYPNWLRSRSKRAVPDDPFFFDQWHLSNTGQGGGTAGEDVNITSVWDTCLASATEVVAIVDDGLEIAHEDLSDNILPGESWDYVGRDTDPTAGDHGTSCAGVVAAAGFNGQGVTGAAPSAGLVGHRLLGAETDANEADALTRNNGLIDIYSNSWGPYDDGQRLEGPGPLTESALEWGVANGRGGLGSIYVWAGGNGYDYDNSNYDGYANSRYTIAAAASTNFGDRASYSEKGANILVNAASSGGSMGIITTDRTGNDGYDDSNYTLPPNSFGGTSSAAPLVSGIIALMLEANPSLSWRDVQHILIQTAEQNDPGDADWIRNGAAPGYWINHKYGFGRIDAQAAVNAALTWTSAGVEANVWGSSAPHLLIPDNNPTGVTDTISIPYDISAEFVEVYFMAAHSYWGDLEITLISPDGTESILAEAHISGNGSYDNWRFGSVRHFGESSLGDWTLKVKDLQADDVGTLESWTVKIYGTGGVPPEADAGPYQEVAEGTVVTLDGSGSTDPDDFIVSYQWVQLNGPTVTLSDTSSAQPTFTAPNVSPPGESLTFQLTVTDNFDLHSTDTCMVDVTGVNDPPTANAGPNQTVTEGTTVTLDGSNSTDPDDGIASYSWEKTSGPAVILSGTSSARTTFTAPDVGLDGKSLTFRLRVTDSGGLESVDTCTVNVTWVQDSPTKGGGGGSGGACFIATAAYGSPMEPHVKILREFRDRYLLTNSAGRALVNLYYTHSPPLADFIARHNRLRAVVRCCLTPIVGVSYVALHPEIAAMALMVLMFSCRIWWERHDRRGRINTFPTRKHHLSSLNQGCG